MRIDQLAILGKPLELEDQIEFILEGLLDEYKHIVDQFEARDTPPSLTELHEQLLNNELKLLYAAPAPHLRFFDNVDYNNNDNNNSRQNQQNQRYASKQQKNWNENNQKQYNRSCNRQPCFYLDRCQIFSTHGHSTQRCPQLQDMQQNASPFPATPTIPWKPRGCWTINHHTRGCLEEHRIMKI